MKGLTILILIVACGFVAGSVQADIYQWTDANGIKHFTNYKPPADAAVLVKSEELPHDEAADRARSEADKKAQLEVAWLELAEREAEIERLEADAERKIAEADRYADEMMKAADEHLEDSLYGRWYYRSDSWGPYDYGRQRYRSSEYGHRPDSIYWKDRSSTSRISRKYREKSEYRSRKNYYDKTYLHQIHDYFQRFRPSNNGRSAGQLPHGAYRVNSRSRGQLSGGYPGAGSVGRLR